MLKNGTSDTRAGALLTTEGVLVALRVREANRTAEQEPRTAHQAEAIFRGAAREKEAADHVSGTNNIRRTNQSCSLA